MSASIELTLSKPLKTWDTGVWATYETCVTWVHPSDVTLLVDALNTSIHANLDAESAYESHYSIDDYAVFASNLPGTLMDIFPPPPDGYETSDAQVVFYWD